jgi:uncharacterized protein
MPAIQAKIVGDFCNLRCTYCRDREFDQAGKRVMTINMLESLINSLGNMPGPVQRMHWLGGEPTLAGLDFFKKVILFQASHPHKRWINTIQTNATLITNEWAEFLRANEFKVGVSVDGTSQTHDADRINLAGRGTYSSVMRGVGLLREAGIQPSVICVVTKRNERQGPQMLRGLVDSGFTSIAFNAFYNVATNFSEDPFAVSDASWAQFLKDIFEEWVRIDRADVKVRELDGIMAWTQGRVARSCVFRGTCSSWMLVDHNGDIYPCERLGRSTKFGNISEVSSFSEVLDNQQYRSFAERTVKLPLKCESCSMKSFCHNGCVAHRMESEDSSPHYVYCGSRLSFYSYLQDQLKEVVSGKE